MSTREKLLEDKEYAPYCIECQTMGRMTKTEKGYICKGEGDYFNRIGCGYTFDFPEEFLNKYKETHGEEFQKTPSRKL